MMLIAPNLSTACSSASSDRKDLNSNGLPSVLTFRVDAEEPLLGCRGFAIAFDTNATCCDRGRTEETDGELAECYGCGLSAGHQLHFRDGLTVPMARDEIVSEDFLERCSIVSGVRIVPRAIKISDYGVIVLFHADRCPDSSESNSPSHCRAVQQHAATDDAARASSS